MNDTPKQGDRPGPSAARLKINMDWEQAAAHVVRVAKPKQAAKKKRAKKKH